MSAVPTPSAVLRDRYAVVGQPVAHSQSPFIHAAFATQTGQRLHYGRLASPLHGFAETLRDFVASRVDGYGPVRGCNVTVPFKLEAQRLAERCSDRAALAQAANVLTFDDAGGWWADNTDGAGLLRDLRDNAGVDIAGARVLLIGAGGAAAGALGPLLEAGPAAVTVVNRTLDRALALVARHALLAEQHAARLVAASLADPGTAYDVVLNATASSLQGAPVPVDASVLRPGTLAVDLMYGAAAAPFMAWAGQYGAVARDGLGMLVEQAAEAFALWRGVRPATADVLAALRLRLAAPPAATE